MPTEIDALSISIEAKAQKANSSIDKLVSRLDVLSNSLGKLQNGSNNLVALGRGVESLSRGMQGFKGVGEAKFIRLANGINQLANINTQGISNAARSLMQISSAFDRVGGMSGNVVQVADLAKNLGKLGNKSVTNAITNIPKLATAMNNLMTTLSKAPTVSENVIRMTNALANLSAQGAKVGSASNSIVKGLNRASNSATRTRASFGGLASVIGKFYATYFLFFRAFNGLWKSINMTADYVEAFNYYTVSFGKIASKWDADWENYGDENARNYANKFVTTLNKTFSKLSEVSYDPQTGLLSETGLQNLGLNLQEVTQYAAQLSSMMDAVGQSGEVTLATTNAFVKLAGDISSLFNIDYQDAAEKIRSVLQGQSRAGYGFGWDTTAAALQETAERFGITKAVSEMAQWEKQQLRILTILEQSRVAYGDQSNTINTLANQIRLFKNNIEEAGMLLGQLFVPMLTKIMPIVNGVTIAIKRLLSSIATLLGIEIKDIGQGFSDLDDGTEDLSDGLDDVAKSAKKAYMGLLGFDKLNVIKTPDTSTSGTGNGSVAGGIDLTDEILQATSEYEKVWQEAFDKMENRAQDFADRIEEFFKPITNPLKDLFKNLSIGNTFIAGQNFSDISSELFNLFSNAIESVDWNKIGLKIGLFFNSINWVKILSSAGNFIETLIDSAIELWKGSFDANPILTSLVTALATAKITGISKATSSLIASNLTATLFGKGIGFIPTIAITGITFVIAFNVGKELGKALFPDDEVWYDGFSFFGENGFFKTIKDAGFANTATAIVDMIANINRLFMTEEDVTRAINRAHDMFIELEKVFSGETSNLKKVMVDAFFFKKEVNPTPVEVVTEWFDEIVQKIFSFSEKVRKLFNGIRDDVSGAFSGISSGIDFGGVFSTKYNVKGFATGGFPNEYSLFMAGEHGHAEMLGTVGGKTAVAGGAEITGIREEIRNTANEEIALLRQQNALLQGILEKEFGITTDAVGRATQSWARDYSRRTGRPAF